MHGGVLWNASDTGETSARRKTYPNATLPKQILHGVAFDRVQHSVLRYEAYVKNARIYTPLTAMGL
jgi:hypothetical protein